MIVRFPHYHRTLRVYDVNFFDGRECVSPDLSYFFRLFDIKGKMICQTGVCEWYAFLP